MQEIDSSNLPGTGNEGIFEFHRKVKASWPAGKKHLWFCCLANPQTWERDQLAALLAGDPLRDSPFAKAMRKAKVMLIVPNSTVSIYTRLWCVAEMQLAIDCGLRVRVATEAAVERDPLWDDAAQHRGRGRGGHASHAARSAPHKSALHRSAAHQSAPQHGGDARAQRHLRKPLLAEFTSVRKAKCSDPDDEQRIRKAIRGREDDIDRTIRRLVKKGK